MNNFIFKSANRLIKNDSISMTSLDKLKILNDNVLYCTRQLDKLHEKIDRLLVDKHLQMQVDDYFKDRPETGDLD